MIVRPRSRRSLLAATVAALPFGAQAALYLPSFDCNSDNALVSIGWDAGPSLSDGIALQLQVDGAVESKLFSCDNKLYSAGTLSGDSFSINFGELKLPAIPGIDYKFEISSVAHKDYIDTFDGKIEVTVSDFNLFVGAYKFDQENKLVLENKFFIGVEVLAQGGSALSAYNKFYVDESSGHLIFDPQIPGGEAVVRLLAAPVPVPEPPALPLVATGLAGIAALLRRRKEPR